MNTCPRCGNALNASEKFCPRCGELLGAGKNPASTAPLQPAQLMHGRYTILRPLSTGGMGALYLASETIAGQSRKVVVKEMLDYYDPADPQGRAKAQGRFEAEAATLAGLNVPGVPQIFDYFSEGGRNFIVMQFIEGQNLQSGLTHIDDNLNEVHGHPYPLDQVRRWGVEICRILDSLSSQKIFHLDIKPANLIVDKSGAIWLVDFGTSKAPRTAQPGSPGGGQTPPQKTSIYGTLGYAPLEQSKGKPDARSDVYALAATLYHLATDDDPGDHPGQFPKLSRLPGELAKALERALVTEVSKRISARELSRLLEPRATRPLGFYWQDGTVTMEPSSLASIASQKWDEARRYFTGDEWEKWLEDQHRHDLANQLRQMKQQQNNPDLALDSYLRYLDPTLPAASLNIPVTNLDAGMLPWRQKTQVDFEIHNTGGGCLLANLVNLPGGLRAEPMPVAVHERQIIQLNLDSGSWRPSNTPQIMSFTIDAGAAGQAQASLQVIVPEPALQISPLKLNLDTIYRGKQLTGRLAVNNPGGSELRGEAICSAPGWSIQPSRFQCAPGKSRQLEVTVDSRRMKYGSQNQIIIVEGHAGAWNQKQTIQAHLVISMWKTFLKFGLPPLMAIMIPAILGSLSGWFLTAGLFRSWQPSIWLGFLVGAMLAMCLLIPPAMLAAKLGWLGTWRERDALKPGMVIGAITGIALGGLVGILAGWIGASLGLTGALIGGLCGGCVGAVFWRQKTSQIAP